MNILDEIIANTKSKLEVRKKEYPLEKIKAELKLSALKKLSF